MKSKIHNREFIVDVTVSYNVTSKELRKKYPDFDTLTDTDQAGRAEQYVKQVLFDVKHLHVVCGDYYDV